MAGGWRLCAPADAAAGQRQWESAECGGGAARHREQQQRRQLACRAGPNLLLTVRASCLFWRSHLAPRTLLSIRNVKASLVRRLLLALGAAHRDSARPGRVPVAGIRPHLLRQPLLPAPIARPAALRAPAKKTTFLRLVNLLSPRSLPLPRRQKPSPRPHRCQLPSYSMSSPMRSRCATSRRPRTRSRPARPHPPPR